ncbi:unnamed protein product [Arabidopsis halleri]
MVEMEQEKVVENTLAVRSRREGKSKLGSCLALLIPLLPSLAPRETSMDPKPNLLLFISPQKYFHLFFRIFCGLLE